jgi:hypothetical protein
MAVPTLVALASRGLSNNAQSRNAADYCFWGAVFEGLGRLRGPADDAEPLFDFPGLAPPAIRAEPPQAGLRSWEWKIATQSGGLGISGIVCKTEQISLLIRARLNTRGGVASPTMRSPSSAFWRGWPY